MFLGVERIKKEGLPDWSLSQKIKSLQRPVSQLESCCGFSTVNTNPTGIDWCISLCKTLVC